MAKKILLASSSLLMCTLMLAGCMNPPTSSTSKTSREPAKEGTIKIDAGGDIAPFTTTNIPPFTYDTLEVLCKEWSEAHPGYNVQVLKTTSNGNRVTLSTQLASGTAAHIIYQNGLVINNDLGKGYYSDLTPYLESENPYEPGTLWKDVYNEAELATTAAADGHYYYVNLEKNPVGILYNETLLQKAYREKRGSASLCPKASEITTFNKLCEVMDVLQEYVALRGGYYVYDSDYRWYELAIETNLFGDVVELGDYLRVNGVCDTEEICRTVKKNIFLPLNGIDTTKEWNDPSQNYEVNRYYEYVKFLDKLESYRALDGLNRDSIFRKGQLGFLEITGKQLRNFMGYLDTVRFNYQIIPFPDLTLEESPNATKPIVRGSAGLASSYWITNTAMNEGLEDQCADLLMFLTSKEQNNRLINEHGGGIPLNPNENLPAYLKEINDKYQADRKEAELGKRNYWGAFNAWGAFSSAFSDKFIRNIQLMHNKTQTAKESAYNICRDLNNNVDQAIKDYNYDQSKW